MGARVTSARVQEAARTRPYPGADGRPQVYLHAGQLHVAGTPTAVTTVLGSCVSVCLFDPETGVGGINHFLLPHQVERERSPRFGTVAVPRLVDSVLRAGGRRGGIRARVFGGASVIHAFRGSRNLGEENARLALRLLEDAGVPVLEADVGGQRGRKLVFHSDEGSVWVRTL